MAPRKARRGRRSEQASAGGPASRGGLRCCCCCCCRGWVFPTALARRRSVLYGSEAPFAASNTTVSFLGERQRLGVSVDWTVGRLPGELCSAASRDQADGEAGTSVREAQFTSTNILAGGWAADGLLSPDRSAAHSAPCGCVVAAGLGFSFFSGRRAVSTRSWRRSDGERATRRAGRGTRGKARGRSTRSTQAEEKKRKTRPRTGAWAARWAA